MHYRRKSVLFAAPWLVIGLVAVGASGGMTLADFEKPELLIAVLFVGVIVGLAVEQLLAATRKEASEAGNQRHWEKRRANSVSGPWLQTPMSQQSKMA
ncbi:hypothetical protein [Sinorhizobium fredii]|uniref:hypothetical protein n=1 Tax=Rhizobium fredii TaxID=380 RepID=UPI0009B6AB55